MKHEVELSPELDLLVQCCQWNFLDASRDRLTLRTGLDWRRFLRLARFHRVQGLAWRALNGSGGGANTEVKEALSDDAKGIAAANLQTALECSRLQTHFAAAKLPHLFLKGLAVGVLAYGDSMLKSSIDTDFLIRPGDLVPSAYLLRELGYKIVIPANDESKTLQRWHRVRKESLWERPGSEIAIDLHTRVADNKALMTGVDIHSPRQLISIGNGIELPTLAPAQQFAYLAVHGASSAWFRLKWISDFAGFLSGLSAAEIINFHREAAETGAGRASGQALLLAHTLFRSLDHLPSLGDQLNADRGVRRLHWAALKQLVGNEDAIEPTSKPLGTLRIHWTQFLLQKEVRFKGSELVRQVRVMLP